MDTCSTIGISFHLITINLVILREVEGLLISGPERRNLRKVHTSEDHFPNALPIKHPALHPHPSPTHTPCLLSLKVLLMISIKPNPPQHPLLLPRPPMLQGPRRDRQETLPKYKFHPLKGEGGDGHAALSRGGAGPCGPEGRVEGCFGLTLLSALTGLSPCKTGT